MAASVRLAVDWMGYPSCCCDGCIGGIMVGCRGLVALPSLVISEGISEGFSEGGNWSAVLVQLCGHDPAAANNVCSGCQ